jgi:hypothetical protein
MSAVPGFVGGDHVRVADEALACAARADLGAVGANDAPTYSEWVDFACHPSASVTVRVVV